MNERIFVIDQDVQTRAFLYDIFTELGFGVLTLPPGPHVLERLQKERPALVFLEDGTDESSGFHLARQIRQFDDRIKIVLLGLIPDARVHTAELAETRVSLYLKKDFQNPDFIKDVLALIQKDFDAAERVVDPKHWGSVLIVDDEEVNRETTSRYLLRHGFDAQTASSGEECLEIVRQRDFDVVLLDITMTGMDGLLTLKKLMDIKPSLRVVMVTALQNRDVAEEARRMGACDYITKPFHFSLLESTLLALLLPQKIARSKSA
jgi:DNA-binding response OmpR family regulator